MLYIVRLQKWLQISPLPVSTPPYDLSPSIRRWTCFSSLLSESGLCCLTLANVTLTKVMQIGLKSAHTLELTPALAALGNLLTSTL